MTARPDLLTPPGLGALLQALRAAGLPIGPREFTRLHHVFALCPGLPQNRDHAEQLRDLLASALTHDPGERELFEQIYRPWAEQWADWERPVEQRRIKDPAVPFAPPAEFRRDTEDLPRWGPKLKVAARLATVAMVAMIVVRPTMAPERTATGSPKPVGDIAPANAATPQEPVGDELPADNEETPQDTLGGEGTASDGGRVASTSTVLGIYTLWLAPSDVRESQERFGRRSWAPFILGVLIFCSGTGLFWRYGREPWMPKAKPAPLQGPAILPLLPLADSGPELLDADGAQTLIWGVGRHLGEDLTHELDLEATVRDTADQGGLPQLRFAPEKRLREVWLWLDATVDEDEAGALPAMERWADEIASSLAAAGLPVRIGVFEGDPSVLRWDEGQLFRPEEVEAHRQTALVAVCTDGAALAAELGDGAGPRTLLRALAAWPRLTWVDFSAGRDLAALLRPFGVACVTPAELPAFFGLGGAPGSRREAEPDPGEIRAWRAALAFGGRPVDRATAWVARRELGIAVSPWAFHSLHRDKSSGPEVPEPRGGQLQWKAEGWTALATWLAEGSLAEPSGTRPGSLLDRTLGFWDQRLADEADIRGRRGPLDPWQDRPAERHLAMEQALLRLWREPAEAAEELFELAAGELREEIRQRLATHAPRDGHEPGDGRMPLPWRFESDLSDRTRWLLAELGLGGVIPGNLRRPGRLGLALGMLVSVGLGLCVVAVAKTPQPRPLDTSGAAAKLADSALDEGWLPMRFVSLKGSVFRMGSETHDPFAYRTERPAHRVRVEDFWIGETEVTNSQYRIFAPSHPGEENQPAAYVNWFEARSYCQSLGRDYDLPTEAEWEYAARAGTSTPWSFGKDQILLQHHAWYKENSDFRAHEVGLKAPNPWGLYDMHGNVWEWVLDCYENNAYSKRTGAQPISDPGLATDSCHLVYTASGVFRMLRGNSFFGNARDLRSAYRLARWPHFSDEIFGFRCVRRFRLERLPPHPLGFSFASTRCLR